MRISDWSSDVCSSDLIAHGFEIVQSIFPGWTFLVADTVAGLGLHGALFVGPRHPVAFRSGDWAGELASFEIDLFRNGALADPVQARNVLDGPVSALRHLIGLHAYSRIRPEESRDGKEVTSQCRMGRE